MVSVLIAVGLRACQNAGPKPGAEELPPPPVLLELDLPTCPQLLAWSADNTRLACAGEVVANEQQPNRSLLFVVDAKSGRVVHRHFVRDKVRCLAWSPDGTQLAVGTVGTIFVLPKVQSGEVIVLDAGTFAVRHRLASVKETEGHGMTDLAWSPDGRELFAIDADSGEWKNGVVRRWAADGTEIPCRWQGDQLRPQAVAVGSGGTVAVVSTTDDRDAVVKVFPPDGKATSGPTVNRDSRLAFSTAGDLVVYPTAPFAPPAWFEGTTLEPVHPRAPRVTNPPAAIPFRRGESVWVGLNSEFTRGARWMSFRGRELMAQDVITGREKKWKAPGGSFAFSGDVSFALSPDGFRLAWVEGGGMTAKLVVWEVGEDWLNR